LKGTAAFAPASDLRSLVFGLGGSAFSKSVSAYLTKAYGQAYPDVAAGNYGIERLPCIVDDIANRCVGDLGTLFSVAKALLLPAVASLCATGQPARLKLYLDWIPLRLWLHNHT
jgi:hypothetical protein